MCVQYVHCDRVSLIMELYIYNLQCCLFVIVCVVCVLCVCVDVCADCVDVPLPLSATSMAQAWHNRKLCCVAV